MIVPQFWAEGRIQGQVDGKPVTIRRFGWSDASPADAQSHAEARTREALARLQAGQQVARREPKRAYNGAEGVPIREQIVARHGETIITRNSYGALCLNTPHVFFADIDYRDWPSGRLTLAVIALLLGVALLPGWWIHWGLGAVGIVVSLVFGYFLAAGIQRLRTGVGGGPEQEARGRIERFVASRPNWYVRLYRTPAGMRVLAMHQTFDPTEPSVAEAFADLGTDPIYARMCLRQGCFRARVSPKPWRIGIGQHLKPRPGVWPVDPERLPERERWVAAYEQAAREYASCQFLAAVGSGIVHPMAAEVARLHDDLCQANRGLPIA